MDVKRPRKWMRWLIGSVVTLFILVCLLVYFAPALGAMAAARWYAGLGDGYKLQIQSWEFSPFNTTLVLQGVRLEHPSKASGVSTLRSISLDIDAHALFDREVRIRDLTLNDLSLDLNVTDVNGMPHLSVAGIEIPLGDTSVPSAAPSNADITPWVIDIAQLTLNNQQIKWQVELTDFAAQGQIEIQTFKLQNLNSVNDYPVNLHAMLAVNELRILGAQPFLLHETAALNLDGQVHSLFTNPTWRGRLDAQNVKFSQQFDLSFESLSIVDVVINSKEQAVGEFNIHNVIVGDFGNPIFSLAHYEVQNIAVNLADNFLNISAGYQEISGLSTQIVINKEGVLEGVPPSTLTALEKESVASEQPSDPIQNAEEMKESDQSNLVMDITPESAAQMAQTMFISIMLSGLTQLLDDGKAGSVHFKDQTISPELDIQLELRELSIGEIDADIEGNSFALQDAIPIRLLAGIDRFNRIEIDSKLALYEGTGVMYPQGRVQVKIRQLDLVKFNGYLVKLLGYQLERGSLDVDGTIIFDKAKLGGELILLLRNSKFVPVDEETIARAGKQISMPLETALDLLRDSNGNIKLKIPLSGDLSNPNVGINDILTQVTRRATRTGALVFLGQALQPYGALLAVTVYAGDYLFAVRLDAIAFEQNQTELTPDNIKHLESVARLMNEKRSIEVQACPFVSEAEVTELGDKWQTLANKRGENVKAWLTQFDSSVGERVSVCRAQQGKKSEVVLGVN